MAEVDATLSQYAAARDEEQQLRAELAFIESVYRETQKVLDAARRRRDVLESQLKDQIDKEERKRYDRRRHEPHDIDERLARMMAL